MTPISIEVAVGVHEADLELRTNAKLRGLSSPGLSDAVILTTARIFHGKVLTGDPHFHGLPETAWLGS